MAVLSPSSSRFSPTATFFAGARFAFVAAVVALSFAHPVTAQNPFRGPLGLTERNPLYDLFYVPLGVGADPLATGETRIDIGVGYSNIFERSDTPTYFQLFDLERLSTTVMVRRNLTPRFEAGARLTVHTSWTGFLDPLIEGVHEAFNVSNGDRALVEAGGYTLVLRQRDGASLLDIAQRGFAPADLHLFGRALLLGGPSRSSAVSVLGTVKIPTGVEGTNTGHADLALEVLGRQGRGPWALHWMLGATTLSAPAPLESLTNDAAVLLGAGVERVVGSNLSLLVQAQTSSTYVSGIGEDELDDFPLIIGFGVAGSSTHWGWQAGFVEDIPPNGPSADITLHVQFSRIWE